MAVGIWAALLVAGQTECRAGDHWAFRRISRPAVPPVKQSELLRTPVDAFLLSTLEAKKLSLGPPADRATLLRRLTFDLIGLPPRPEEIEQFVSDVSPDAYLRVVERLLASPHYGERWGKYWLDVAGYADSNGYFNADTDRPWAFRYRDYVIRAFNADKPFDQFIREQLAGDELAGAAAAQPLTPRVLDLLAATHFLRNSQDGTGESDGNPDELRIDKATVLQGTLQITMNSLLGVTIQCCRCHEHKFEPIQQAEYYQLQSIFYPAFPAYDPEHWIKPKDRLRTLANSGAKPPEAKKKSKKKAKEQPRDAPPAIAYVTDLLESPPTLHVLKRGNYTDLGEVVVPAGLRVLCDGPNELKVREPFAGSKSTGRRLAFARWLTDPESRASSLLARVMVNRIWQRHFGRGIVTTPDNFGVSGSAPTHPELLEYLAAAFRNSGWSMKAIHRLVVLSAAYQQSSAARSVALAVDPDDRLLWRFPLGRLDAEALRDAMLAVSGELSETLYGPYIPSTRGDDGGVVVAEKQAGAHRRGVYLQQRRTQVDTLLELFDAPVMVSNCAVRGTSTVPLQSLALLNSEFIRARAMATSAKLRASLPDHLNDEVRRAIRAAFGRDPTAPEQAASTEFLKKQSELYGGNQQLSARAWDDFYQMLFASNAFLYVE